MPEEHSRDAGYMRRAIALAQKGAGWCHPNPKVGAVIVKDGRVIGEGYHAKYGQLHAERNAFAALSEAAEGATLYVTLEPCCFYGKTPPCTEAIIENKIARVVIGSRDPNPQVAGKGAEILRKAGIEVEEAFLKEECDALNPIFFHFITERTPYVIMKYAMTMDGKIATKTGASRWISGPDSLHRVHELRNECMAIMVGIGTVLADDPMLNCRLQGGRDPIRIVCDSRLRIPLDAQLCRTADEYESDTIVVCANAKLPVGELRCSKNAHIGEAEKAALPVEKGLLKKACGSDFCKKAMKLNELGVRIFNYPGEDGRVDLAALSAKLGADHVDSILLEGGGSLNESALRAGIVKELKVFLAPKIFGGEAKSPVQGLGVESPGEAYGFRFGPVEVLGDDLLLTGVREEEV